jgi:PBP1b-binding outer membrane lipoprotein LpoB
MKKITLSLLIGAMALVSCSPNSEETVEVPTTDSTATVSVEPDTTVSAQSDSTVVDTTAVGA